MKITGIVRVKKSRTIARFGFGNTIDAWRNESAALASAKRFISKRKDRDSLTITVEK